ncbi:hypothetical protein CF394_06990 [Tetzosporium hominis]|uniref:Recombinase domain-containing protein n=1 Tax=Tetzosporium hominis TaxID=2020506 RepID=A0A264W4L0_9BACL|nr:recombinase family protein [Tetzosporium hominis]OZS78495.1 hypothetical protein CF394_06990 [Tetzosporium hominis]
MIDEEQAAVIRNIYEGYLKGKSTKSIARELTEKGVLSPRGLKAWNANTVDSLLRNETVCGTIKYQKTYSKDYLAKKQVRNQGELPQYVIEDHHPPIIDPEMFEQVQQEMKSREIGRSTKKKYSHQTAFFKLFYCGKCGNIMNHVAYSNKNKEGERVVRHYWRCTVALGHKFITECDAPGYREEMIELTFMNMLHEMKDHPQLIFEAKQAIQEVGLSEGEQEQLGQLKQKVKDYYYDLYKEVEAHRGDEDFDVNSSEMKQLTDKIIAIENELEVYNERLEKVQQMQEDLDWLLDELKDLKKYQLRRRATTFRDDIFSRLIKRGEVQEDGRVVYDLCLGIQWTAYGADQALPRRNASKKNKKR